MVRLEGLEIVPESKRRAKLTYFTWQRPEGKQLEFAGLDVEITGFVSKVRTRNWRAA